MNKINNIREWCIAILIFLFLQPYPIWSVYGSLQSLLTLALVALCFTSINLNEIDVRDVIHKGILSMIFVWLAFKLNLSLIGTVGIMSYSVLVLASEKLLLGAYNKFIKIFVVTTSISAIVYLLVVVLGLNVPYDNIAPLNTLKSYTYNAYPFLVIPNGEETFRFFGCFDEPGVIGTICAVILLMRKFDLKQKENILILIFGIISFSLFFYLISLIYALLFARPRYKILVISLSVAVSLLVSQESILYELIFARMQFEDGQMVGNNRDIGLDEYWYENFKHSNDYWWGLGPRTKQLYNPGGASYKDRIIEFGAIFFFAYVGAFIMYGIHKLRPSLKNILIYILVICSVLFQRPFITNITYILMIYIPILSLSNEYNKQGNIRVQSSI